MTCEFEVLSFLSMCCVFVLYKLGFKFEIHKNYILNYTFLTIE